jgi:hypothetical protein
MMRSVFRVLIITGSIFVVTSTNVTSTVAEPARCERLRQQLSSGSGRSNSGAIQQQEARIQNTRAKARQAGCGGFLFSRGDPEQCARFDRTIDQQSARLESLKRGSGASRSTSNISASLEANGCAPQRPRKFLEVLFGKGDPTQSAREPISRHRERKPLRTLPKAEIQQPRSDRIQASVPKAPKVRRAWDPPETLATTYEGSNPVGTVAIKKGYRTLCVRTCDGYYFPISFSTKSKNFARDQKACSAMCPAGDAKLYYHSVPGQESGDMVSVADKVPYSALPNAFQYRTVGLRAVPGCACHAAAANMPLAANAANTSVNEMLARALPISSPAKGGLKNVQMASINGMSDHKTDASPITIPANLMSAGYPAISPDPLMEKNIRIVGPAFYPKVDETIDLRAPPRKRVVPTRYTPETAIATLVSHIWRNAHQN